jgi:hypothetical protein
MSIKRRGTNVRQVSPAVGEEGVLLLFGRRGNFN